MWAVLGGAAAVVVLVPAVGAGVLVGPYVRDDFVLDQIVPVVALEWRDFGEARAWERLQFELDRRNVGEQVGDESCELVPTEGGGEVRCVWTADVVIPWTNHPIPLRFSSRAVR